MSCLLTIDTSLETALLCISRDGELLKASSNHSQKDHASWLQPALEKLLQDTGILLSELNAIAVVAGPGSYTGLRVGMASAKGLCYALKVPLILLDNLYIMAASYLHHNGKGIVCPMIDARRMEVFTAVYESSKNRLMAPTALVLEADSFENWIKEQPVFFIGNGAAKYKVLLKSANAFFPDWQPGPMDFVRITQEMYDRSEFAELAYSEPFYVKAFYDPVKAKS
jgi:tRNA threonylcarbamoyladenosine biosynthesis protein TsaB